MFFLGFAPLLKPRWGLQHDSPPTHLQCFLPNIFWWEFHRTLSCEPLPFYQLCQTNKSLVEVASTRQPGLLLSSVWQGVKHIASSWQIINAKPASGSLCWLLLLRAEVTHAQFPGVNHCTFQSCSSDRMPQLEYCASLRAKGLPETSVFILWIPVTKKSRDHPGHSF